MFPSLRPTFPLLSSAPEQVIRATNHHLACPFPASKRLSLTFSWGRKWGHIGKEEGEWEKSSIPTDDASTGSWRLWRAHILPVQVGVGDESCRGSRNLHSNLCRPQEGWNQPGASTEPLVGQLRCPRGPASCAACPSTQHCSPNFRSPRYSDCPWWSQWAQLSRPLLVCAGCSRTAFSCSSPELATSSS